MSCKDKGESTQPILGLQWEPEEDVDGVGTSRKYKMKENMVGAELQKFSSLMAEKRRNTQNHPDSTKNDFREFGRAQQPIETALCCYTSDKTLDQRQAT